MKTYLALIAASVIAISLQAAVSSFPGCEWSETTVKRSHCNVSVLDAKGRMLLAFHAEPHSVPLDKLVVSQAVDRLVIDARALFADGPVKLVFTTPNFDPAPYAGKDCALVCDIGGARGAEGHMCFEGHAGKRHCYSRRAFAVMGHRKSYAMVHSMDTDLDTLHLRWDITMAATNGPVELFGARYAPAAEMPLAERKNHGNPELLFRAAFDGTAEATVARGAAKPLRENGLEYGEGKTGKAVRLTAKAKSVLDYAAAGNLVPECGTVCMWFKREWPDKGRNPKGGEMWRTMFSNPSPKGFPRVGSGQLWFWWRGGRLRAEQSDDDDAYAAWNGSSLADGWNHLAVTWDEPGVRIFVNGKQVHSVSDGASPMRTALQPVDVPSFSRQRFESFGVGHLDGDLQFDGLIDDLRIYSAPLGEEEIRNLWRSAETVELKAYGCYALAGVPGEVSVSATSPVGRDISKLAYCICAADGKVVSRYKTPVSDKTAKLKVNLPAGSYSLRTTDGSCFYGSVPFTVLRADNPYELSGAAAEAALSAPGRLANIELETELMLDVEPPADIFRATGRTQVKKLGGVPYLEAGSRKGDRYALRFDISTNTPLHLFEIDYPDDAKRTADLIVQRARRPGGDYTMQVGYATGDEYPNTGRMLTHRCLYWASEPDVALVAMTARANAPAAIAAVRIYRVKNGALPPETIREPKPADGGWKRSFALYFEDPAIGYDFASDGHQTECLDDLIDRTAAFMKFTGQNMLAYPGAWYHGLIGERYNPRAHAPDFLSAWYAKFDREGLMLVPTLNVNTMPVPEGLVTRESMSDGSLHGSVIAIHSTGKPNWGGWHNTPPNFNFHHPKVRKHIAAMIDELVAQGKGHPSFKGVCLHLTRHCMLWFGDEASGYNDYTLAAFAKAKGIRIPVKKDDPMRGKAYADWLRANAWEDWLQWRCDEFANFYAGVARKLAAARPDLKLWINSSVTADVSNPDFTRPDYMERANRACGLDRDRLTAAIPNLILCQTLVPADYRHRHEDRYPTPEVRAHQRVLDTLPGFYSLLKGARYPWVNQHDRYWESPIGRGSTLSCDWLTECTWRVSTINPGGFHALRHFVLPLRYGDVLGMSKGGFLIGTYGMEEVLVPFMQAFRALPAVVFDDAGGTETVKLRHKDFDGKSWFYVVNTDMKPARVRLSVPERTRDLVTGEQVSGPRSSETLDMELGPYEMRSYAAPDGLPSL